MTELPKELPKEATITEAINKIRLAFYHFSQYTAVGDNVQRIKGLAALRQIERMTKDMDLRTPINYVSLSQLDQEELLKALQYLSKDTEA